jgi:hypothetical protein
MEPEYSDAREAFQSAEGKGGSTKTGRETNYSSAREDAQNNYKPASNERLGEDEDNGGSLKTEYEASKKEPNFPPDEERVEIPYGIESAVGMRDGDKYKTKAMNSSFDNERQKFPGLPTERTRYYSNEEREEHQLSFQDGLVNQGEDLLDTTDAQGSTLKGSKADRHIFAMDGQGKFTATDAAMSKFTKGEDGKVERIHHSSLVQGEPVAAAGEIEVEEGHIRSISDHSGHYKPTGEMTFNAVSALQDHGALLDTSLVNEEAINKPANVNLVGKDVGEEEIILTSQQYLQTEGNEEQIRLKNKLNEEINELNEPEWSGDNPAYEATGGWNENPGYEAPVWNENPAYEAPPWNENPLYQGSEE